MAIISLPNTLMLCASFCGFASWSVDGAVTAASQDSQKFLDRRVTVHDVEKSLQSSLQGLLLAGRRDSDASRLSKIEEKIWQTYAALPQNHAGRLASRAVRYIVHSYFVREHGWLIKGLEPHGMMPNMTEVHDVQILQDKVPALVEALLATRRSGRGLALADVVAMIAALEELIFDESTELLEDAYMLNNRSVMDSLDQSSTHEVLRSYLLLFGEGARTRHDFEMHQLLKNRSAELTESWDDLTYFEQDALLNFAFANRHRTNPFKPITYSFSAVSEVVQNMAREYGKWQNEECKHMQAELEDLDMEGNGRIPLSSFYSQQDAGTYQFTESVDYLQQIGALDESDPQKPRVVIVNYITGPSNCIASFPYYSVCCLSSCHTLLAKLEAIIRSPSATPDQIIGCMSNVSSDSGEAMPVTEALTEKLHQIASKHHGEVPLHGRLFAQWLHFVYPSVCPYPAIVKDSRALAADRWQPTKFTISPEERAKHVDQINGSSAAGLIIQPAMAQWTDDERLPVQEPAGVTFYMVVQLAFLLAAWLGGAVAWFAVFRRTAGVIGHRLPFSKQSSKITASAQC